MKKYIAVAVALVALVWAFYNYLPGITPIEEGSNPYSSPLLPSFSVPSFKLPTLEHASVKTMAIGVWEAYLEAAKAHDLPKLKNLSHQLSLACSDPTRKEECFGLMDSVYFFGSGIRAEDFKYIESDNKQIIMYTDGPDRSILYFTKDAGNPKVLGLRFCSEDENNPELTCADLNVDTRDDDNDGWWNSTESFFK